VAYFAHTDGTLDKQNWHKLSDHLVGVAALAEKFARKFGAGDLGRIAGLLHDIGKYSQEFQTRLGGKAIWVDHSTLGAQEAVAKYQKWGKILAYVIAGHHSGLPDGGSVAGDGSLASRLQKQELADASPWREEIALPHEIQVQPQLRPINKPGMTLSFFIRMLYSCLVDADFLDTERYMEGQNYIERGNWPAMAKLHKRLNTYLQQKQRSAPSNKINRLRAKILADCRRAALQPPGIFTLTVPTGGGKTLSSLAFAMDHLLHNQLDRIIYVMPYTSIIEQNAEVFRQAVGKEVVLEHHSNYQPDFDSDIDSETRAKVMRSAENWDIPLVATTNVQFFESLFANRSSKCRKLHNISRSVIILDEAQLLPLEYLKPCLAALIELVFNYGSTVVLCTATQPAFKQLMPSGVSSQELARDVDMLYEAFRRVNVSYIGDKTDSDLIEELAQHRQVLCIVNTRRHANKLYSQLSEVKNAYHLSARMCAKHRTEKLKEISKLLQAGEDCRLISTQLIEAGVDIDFPVVYRSIAGVDSIAQSAGRCNREGKLSMGKTLVFAPEKHGLPAGWFSRCAEISKMVLREFADPLSLDAVRRYFEYLYSIDDEELDKKQILKQLNEDYRNLNFPFAEIANEINLIDSYMISVIIPWDDKARQLIRQLQFAQYSLGIARQLQPYTIQIYRNEFIELQRSRAIYSIAGTFHILANMDLYKDDIGLTLVETTSPSEVLIF